MATSTWIVLAWLALVAFLVWINADGRGQRDHIDADFGEAGEG